MVNLQKHQYIRRLLFNCNTVTLVLNPELCNSTTMASKVAVFDRPHLWEERANSPQDFNPEGHEDYEMRWIVTICVGTDNLRGVSGYGDELRASKFALQCRYRWLQQQQQHDEGIECWKESISGWCRIDSNWGASSNCGGRGDAASGGRAERWASARVRWSTTVRVDVGVPEPQPLHAAVDRELSTTNLLSS